MNDTRSGSPTAFLGTEPLFPLLLKMGIPATIAMLVNALYNIVDTIFVGRGVGPDAIAALTIVFPIQMIVSALAQAIGVGSASIVSRRLGEKREKDAARTIGTAYSFIAIMTAILVALVLVFITPILAFFGASEEIMPIARAYLGVVAPGFFFFAASMAASALVRAEGNARASMTGMLIGAVLNCFLDPLFIFAFGMGVKGAAIATVLSQAASCAYLLSLYLGKKTHVALAVSDFRPRFAILRESAILGAPAFIQSAGMSLLALLINTTLGNYGGDRAISIYGMIHKLLMLVIFPILGMAQGFQPIAGYNFGARSFDRVRAAIRVAILTVFGIACVSYGVVMIFPFAIVGMFTIEPDLIAESARVLRRVAMLIPLAAVQIIGSTYFQAVGKRMQSLVLGLSRQFLILIPLILILPRFFGLEGIWFAYPLADLISSTITIALLIRELRHLGREPH
ncbi:MAG: MATE family efflux transporter [Spirochaetaceae bacterium]|nr:MATE family efflux transporter [Spirochaetaceae bacterium]